MAIKVTSDFQIKRLYIIQSVIALFLLKSYLTIAMFLYRKNVVKVVLKVGE